MRGVSRIAGRAPATRQWVRSFTAEDGSSGGAATPRTNGLARAFIVGHIGQDAKIVSYNDETKAAYFSVATSTATKNRETGQLEQRTDWYQVVARSRAGGIADSVEKFAKKGALIYVEGPIELRQSKDANGVERTSVSLRLLSNANVRVLTWPRNEGGADKGGSGERGNQRGVFGETGQVYD